MNLTVTIQKSLGSMDYVQIMSDDQMSVNVVLMANKIVIRDMRP